jgi:serine phosphatase RsbU (regulator of sigma subunit)
MRRPVRRTALALIVLLELAAAGKAALAQQGDDPRWAEPGFDDSQWRVAETTRALSPQGMPEVLHNLNRALISKGDSGFTTACCLRVEAHGDFSFANAGHLNPFLEGRELESPGVLPLGLEQEHSYATVTGHLQPGQRLVLLSDGVPEARTQKGVLLGFERLGERTRKSAEEIADAAQHYGQNDDITVTSLALAGAEAIHA